MLLERTPVLIPTRVLRLLEDGDWRELFHGASSTVVLKVLGIGVGYLFNLAVVRTLGVAAWGAFALSLAVITMGSVLGRLGMDAAALRLIAGAAGPDRRARIRAIVGRATAVILPVSALVGVLLYVSAGLLATVVFRKPGMTEHLQIASYGVPGLAMTYLSSQSLRGLKRVREYVFFDLVGRFLAALLLLPAVLLFVSGPTAAVWAFVAGTYVIAAANHAVLHRRITAVQATEPAPVGQPAVSESLNGMIALGAPLLLANSIFFLKGWVDTLMLGAYVPEAQVGIYHIALKVAALTSLPLLAVNTIAAPKYAEAYARGEIWRIAKVVRHSGALIACTSFPLAVALWAFSRPILGLFGAEVRQGSLVLAILVASSLVNAFAGSVSSLLQMTGRVVAYQNVTLGVLVLNVASNFVLIPRWGIEGAAVSTALGLVVWNLACLLLVRRHLGIWTLPFPRRGGGRISPVPEGGS